MMSSSLENTSIFLVFTATDASIPDLKQKEEDSHLMKRHLWTKKKKKRAKIVKKETLLLNTKKRP